MTKLSESKCIPCRKGDPALTDAEIAALHPQVSAWNLIQMDNISRLERIFKFIDYKQAVEFTNKLASIAEDEDHHPLIILEWGKVTVQ